MKPSPPETLLGSIWEKISPFRAASDWSDAREALETLGDSDDKKDDLDRKLNRKKRTGLLASSAPKRLLPSWRLSLFYICLLMLKTGSLTQTKKLGTLKVPPPTRQLQMKRTSLKDSKNAAKIGSLITREKTEKISSSWA